MTGAGDTIQTRGLRVLVVEDSFLIAWSLRRMLNDFGCEVIGPASTVEDAIRLINESGCDAGILDINLGSETSMPVAAALIAKGCPFVFVTGYSSPSLLEVKYSEFRRLRKPISESVLRSAIVEELRGEREQGLGTRD
ncbi:MAG: response regulator [Pyrinomonadaceae bacterium]|nr:response regulator [Phycisphaerales bacterium]